MGVEVSENSSLEASSSEEFDMILFDAHESEATINSPANEQTLNSETMLNKAQSDGFNHLVETITNRLPDNSPLLRNNLVPDNNKKNRRRKRKRIEILKKEILKRRAFGSKVQKLSEIYKHGGKASQEVTFRLINDRNSLEDVEMIDFLGLRCTQARTLKKLPVLLKKSKQ